MGYYTLTYGWPSITYLLWIAAALMALTKGVHLFAGTTEIMGPILASDLRPVIRATAMVVWHAITLLLALMTFAIGYLAQFRNPALLIFVIVVQLSFAGVFLWYTLAMLGGLFILPQWTVFLLVPLLMGMSHVKDA